MNSSNPFLQAARSGENALWRYLLNVLAVSLVMLITSTAAVLVALGFLKESGGKSLQDLPPLIGLVVGLMPFPLTITWLDFGLHRLHHRGMATLFHPAGRFRWELLMLSGGLWLVVSALGDGALSLVYTGSYHFSNASGQFWPYALVAAFLLPMQVSAEELWFRGYLTQGMGLAGGPWLAWLGPAVLFGLLHGYNPEVSAYGLLWTMPVYIGMGLLLGWVTLRSAGLEMALGLHLANNLYATLLVGAPVSALPAPALFSVDQYHPEAALAVTALGAVIYVVVAVGVMQWKR